MNDVCTLLDTLHAAIAGLLWTSEIDAPVEVCHWTQQIDADLTANQFLQWIGQPPATAIEEIGVEECFAGVVTEQEWFGEEDRIAARRYQELLEVLLHSLQALRVFRVGEVRIDLYIVGRTRGSDWIGLKTQVVET